MWLIYIVLIFLFFFQNSFVMRSIHKLRGRQREKSLSRDRMRRISFALRGQHEGRGRDATTKCSARWCYLTDPPLPRKPLRTSADIAIKKNFRRGFSLVHSTISPGGAKAPDRRLTANQNRGERDNGQRDKYKKSDDILYKDIFD